MAEVNQTRILLVEDNPGDARLVRTLLAETGSYFEIDHVERLADAVSRLAGTPYDVILLDLSLPDAKGLDTVIRARAAAPDRPIVIMTGLDDEQMAVDALKQGAQDYLVKGQFDGRLLVRAMRYAVEREHAETALRQSEERFRRFFENDPEYCYMVSPAGRILDVNRSALAALGYAKGELTGRPLADVYAPESRAKAEQMLADWWRTGRLSDEAVTIITREGTRFEVLLSIYEVRDDTGTVVHSVAVQRDITQLKLTEEALRQSEQRFRRVFDGAPIGIAVTDFPNMPSRFVQVNWAFAEMLGYTPEEMTRLTFMDVTCADDRQESLRMTNEMLAGDLPGFRLEKRYIRKDGSLMWASTVVTDLKGDDGRPLFGLAMVEDISARKRHERELAQKNEELQRLNDVKNQFLGMAAHDLRNPVAVIFAASSFMLEEESRCLSPEKRVEFVQRIRANSQFMARLLEDLLDLSRIEAGQIQLQKQALDLSELVGRSVEQNGLLAAPKEIRVDFACDSQLPKVAADAGRLDQVLNNLISNAVKFSNPGTTVTVNAARQNGSVVVSVQDRGQGIPADEMSRLFKPFQKTSVRGTAGERSTGLGLAICRQIIEAHGGRIWAESTAGKGSTFAFTLPAERAAGHSEQ